MTISKEQLSLNLENIKNKLKPYNARLICVTKYVENDVIQMLYELNQRDFGENRAVDAIKKINSTIDEVRTNSIYHYIGHIQTNKIKKIVGTFKYIHSVDSTKQAIEISRIAEEQNIKQKILIQVNNANEPQKFGVAPSKLNNLLSEISTLKNIEVVGLMNIAPNTEDKKKLNNLFSEMNKLKEEFSLKELSMGMSNDFEIALENGATMIRLGHILYKEGE